MEDIGGQVKSQSWEEVQKGKGIEDTQSSNAFWDRRVGERKGRGERAKKAKCELRWAGGQSRVGTHYQFEGRGTSATIHCAGRRKVLIVGTADLTGHAG
jgi:hypothetical protein